MSTLPLPLPLTAKLLSSSSQISFAAATQSPFLVHAGRGTLSKAVLQRWLGQDRLYAQAYVRFAGLLLVNVPLLGGVIGGEGEGGGGGGGRVNERLQDLLVDSLTNIRRELKFFEDVATRYGLDISVSEDDEGDRGVQEGVKLYRQLFKDMGEGVESGEVEMLDAMVVLWGTEKCYLEAWRYALSSSSSSSSVTSQPPTQSQDKDGGALRKEFIPNWTSEEFVAFVDQIGDMVDLLWSEGQGGFVARSKVDAAKGRSRGEKEEQLRTLWQRVLDVEKVFWPIVGEDGELVK